MKQEFKLQDPGEGVREVDILEVLVAEGDTVEEGQDVLVVESDKAAIELPSPYDGRVAELRVKAGDTAVVGDVLMVVEDDAGAEPGEDAAARSEEPEPEPEEERGSAGDEARDEDGDEDAEEAEEEAGEEDAEEAGEDREDEAGAEAKTGAKDREGREKGRPVPASPAARKLARERGVNLADVEPSGADGQVTVGDVRAAAPEQPAETEEAPGREAPGAEAAGERRRMSAIRAATARAMARSWREIPQVVHEDAADITELERWRRRQGEDAAPPLTPIVAKAASIVLQAHPRFNASLDTDTDEIVLHRDCNISIAVATDRGLVTPVVRGVRGKPVRVLAEEMAALAERARSQKLEKDDLSGGTFTITNVGALGGRGLSPLVNPPQTAILGLARARLEPVVRSELDAEGRPRIEARMILPLAVTFDHRVIDGADAARFTNDLVALLSDPVSLALDA